MLRLAHISDLHLTQTPLPWQWRDRLSKRAFTWLNLKLGRNRKFARADQVLRTFVRSCDERRIDHIVFSGDASALGFEAEFRRVADILDVEHRPGLAVPGNHDYCTPRAARSGAFERVFAPWQQGERIDAATYPFAQRVGPLWLVGVNSAKGNRWFWDASGRVGADQRHRLVELLKRLAPGPHLLVTHYPICLASGRRERFDHGLRDLHDTLGVCSAGNVGLWLHGHRHGFYALPETRWAPFPVICAGSTTQEGLWSYGEYEMDDKMLRGVRRVYDPAVDLFRDADSFTLNLGAV